MFGEKQPSTTEQLFGKEAAGTSSVSKYLFPEEPACAQCCPNLSYTQRLMGFCCFAGFGYVLTMVGTVTLVGGFNQENVQTFAALYVSGNVIALGATGFLIGPKKQCINMWKPTRRYTTAFYLIMLIVVFVVAIAEYKLDGKIYLILFLLFIQICAAVWYSASYVPYGREMISGVLRKIGICFPCYFVYDAVKDANKEPSMFGGSQA